MPVRHRFSVVFLQLSTSFSPVSGNDASVSARSLQLAEELHALIFQDKGDMAVAASYYRATRGCDESVGDAAGASADSSSRITHTLRLDSSYPSAELTGSAHSPATSRVTTLRAGFSGVIDHICFSRDELRCVR